MVAYLGLRTYELIYEEIGNSIAEILSAWEKAEWGSQPFSTHLYLNSKL